MSLSKFYKEAVGYRVAGGHAADHAAMGIQPSSFNMSAIPAPIIAGRVFRPDGFSALTGQTFARVYKLYKSTGVIRLLFTNLAMQGGTIENSVGTYTISGCGILFGSTKVVVTFQGSTSINVPTYGVVISDPIILPSAFVSAGSAFRVDTYVTQTGGLAYLPTTTQNNVISKNGYNEGYLNGDFSATTNSFGGASASVSFGPTAVIGFSNDTSNNTTALFGDSITAGTGFSTYITPSSFAMYALDQQNVSGINGARGGETLASMNTYVISTKRMANAVGMPRAITCYGTNDVGAGTTTSALKALYLTHWNNLKNIGIKTIYQTTLLPRVNTTDGFRTASNQTLFSGSTQEQVRQDINKWLRAPVSAGAGNSALFDAMGVLFGVFDTALSLEVNSNNSLIVINPSTGAISNGVGGFTYNEPTIYDSGTVTGTTTANLTDTSKVWTPNQWLEYSVIIVTDSGNPSAVGQSAPISANTTNRISVDSWRSATVASGVSTVNTPSSSATYAIMKIFTYDGIHPSTQGHYKMANAIVVS